MRTVISAAIVITGVMISSSAFAECACVTSKVDTSNTVGEIVHSNGEVLYTGKTGFADAKPGSKLVTGSQVSTGPGASASLSVGKDCAFDLPENSEASVLKLQDAGTKKADANATDALEETEFDVEMLENNICLEVTNSYGQFLPIVPFSPFIPVSFIAGEAGVALSVSGGNISSSR